VSDRLTRAAAGRIVRLIE